MQFQSREGRYALTFDKTHLERVLKTCAAADVMETGGILAGYYNEAHDRAIITGVSRAPADSRGGRTWFNRGIRGLQRWVDRFWFRERRYYLGEWHFHPYAAPN